MRAYRNKESVKVYLENQVWNLLILHRVEGGSQLLIQPAKLQKQHASNELLIHVTSLTTSLQFLTTMTIY